MIVFLIMYFKIKNEQKYKASVINKSMLVPSYFSRNVFLILNFVGNRHFTTEIIK